MADHVHEPTEPAIRAEALEALLVEQGLLTSADVDAVIARFAERVGPLNGARVVARAWCDDAFRARLLADATETVGELGIKGGPGGEMEKLVVVENSDAARF